MILHNFMEETVVLNSYFSAETYLTLKDLLTCYEVEAAVTLPQVIQNAYTL